MNKECTEILNTEKVVLVNDEKPMRTLIKVREYNQPLLNYRNIDWWLIIGEKEKRQKRKHQRGYSTET